MRKSGVVIAAVGSVLVVLAPLLMAQRARPNVAGAAKADYTYEVRRKSGDGIAGRTLQRFGQVSINDKGELAYLAYYTVPGTPVEHTGIFLLDRPVLAPAPIDPKRDLLARPPHINNNGDVAFVGQWNDSTRRMQRAQTGVFLNDTLVIQNGMHPRLLNDGRIAYWKDNSVYIATPPSQGEPAAPLKIGNNALQFRQAYGINDRGQVIGRARVSSIAGSISRQGTWFDKDFIDNEVEGEWAPVPAVNTAGLKVIARNQGGRQTVWLGDIATPLSVGQLKGDDGMSSAECPWVCFQLNDRGSILYGTDVYRDGRTRQLFPQGDPRFWTALLGHPLVPDGETEISINCAQNNQDQVACTIQQEGAGTTGYIVVATPAK